MIPKPPPREQPLGFLYIPPFRIQGLSIAGEMTSVQAPELDVCFDIGGCPRPILASKYVAISHGHMDHVGGLAYYCSQRAFQGMGTGNVVCDARLAPAIRKMMEGYVELEQQITPYELIPLEPEQEIEIKNNIFLRGFELEHAGPTFGYVIVEKRSKLRPEFGEFPQEKLRELKDRGVEITRILEVPLVAYLGDTAPCPPLVREDVRRAQIVISECTFLDAGHKQRARVGKHLHIDDIVEWLPVLECEALVLIHLSRRTHMGEARRRIAEVIGEEGMERVHVLMDHRANRARYERQAAEAEQKMRESSSAP